VEYQGSLDNTLAIRFKDTFAKHFSPHQFGVATSGKCETIVHDILGARMLWKPKEARILKNFIDQPM